MRGIVRSSLLPLAIGSVFAQIACDDSNVGVLRGQLAVECCADVAEVDRASEVVDFGDVQVGIQMTRELVLKNAGTGLLTIMSVTPDERFSTSGYEFKMGDGAVQLAPNQARNVTVSFQPFSEMASPVESVVTFTTDAKDEKHRPVPALTLTVRGRGVRSGLEVVPNPIDFGKVLIGSSSTMKATLTNRLSVPTGVFSRLGRDGKAEIVNQGGSGRFELVSPVAPNGSLLPPSPDGSPALLEPNASVEVELRYTPDQGNVGRQERARWTIANCENALCEFEVPLLGTGTNTAIECVPAAVAFGDVNPSSVVKKKTTCKNVATEDVTVSGWSLATGAAREYTVAPYAGSPSRLTPGAAFDVELTFSPTAASVGMRPTAALLIRGRNPRANRDLDPTRVEISGNAGGPDIAVSPAMLNFGQIALGTSGRRRLLIENTGYSALNVTGVQADVAATGVFEADRSAFAVQPGDSAVVTVTFRPSAVGEVASTLVITSDDADEGEVRVELHGQGADLPPCEYKLSTTDVSFGIVQVLRSTTQGMRIENVGTHDCLVNDIEIAPGSDTTFGLLNGSETGVVIPPGGVKSVIVTYTPDNEGLDSGQLTFYISDPNNANPEVGLRGVGSTSALLISPNEVDFGRIGVDCSTRDRTISVFNTGALPTTVQRIERPVGITNEFQLDHLPMGIPSPPGAGVVIQPGASIEFVIRYHANDVGIDTGFIHLYEAGKPEPYVLPVYGEGARDATNEDRFTQLETPQVDILFVIDNSCSMSEEQASLTGNFRSFIQFADSQALDYHIAAVTTDVGESATFGACPNPPVGDRPPGLQQGQCGYFADGNADGTLKDPSWRIITSETQPSAEGAFGAIAAQGTGGSGLEQGLEGAYRALSSPVITGWNGNFLRPNAYLAVIAISDEEDQSTPTVDFYTNFFLAIKGFRNTQLFSFSAIVGDAPSGCNGSGGNADVGARYIEVARRTGGVFESICTSDWAQALQNLGLSVFGYKSRFFLSNQPVPGSVHITVDGVSLDNAGGNGQVRWGYDAATNSVNFSPLAIPEPGSEIVITYTAECL